MTEPTNWLNECREALIELRDQQALPRKAAGYQRQIDELDAHIAAETSPSALMLLLKAAHQQGVDAGTQPWLPISTAPKDGTPVLVWDSTDMVQTTAAWREDGMRHLDGTTGQFYLCSTDAYGERHPASATHWKPLGPGPIPPGATHA